MPRDREEDDDGVEFEDVLVKHLTEKALLVEIEGDPYWVPFSQIHEDSELNKESVKDETGMLKTTTWWSDKEGLS